METIFDRVEQRGITIGEQRGEQRGIMIGEQREKLTFALKMKKDLFPIVTRQKFWQKEIPRDKVRQLGKTRYCGGIRRSWLG